ncbi:uncharacterized protein wu:fb74b10 [Platichthys flesus]|uniref:uncharacterized protein wu:fb74b10 n=1 Tax=Platichthys flesus TaxID=8260 RepID=UPI002DB5FEED|nr:uncharacterized protein wu:fb74b10 [Platichthys flesus]
MADRTGSYATRKGHRAIWGQETEHSLIEIWQEHQCLFDVSSSQYHNRVEKEKAWREIAKCLQQPVQEVKTRATSLRTQYSRLIKPKPNGGEIKPLTPRQQWLIRAMDFIKPYIVHRPCETAVDMSLCELDDSEEQEDHSDSFESVLLSRPETPETLMPRVLRSASSCELSDEGASPTREPAQSAPRGVKRKARTEDIELQKLLVLKQMAAKVDADHADGFTTFGNQVASELRLISDPANLTRLKRQIVNMIYDTQDSERKQPPAAHKYKQNTAPTPLVQSKS